MGTEKNIKKKVKRNRGGQPGNLNAFRHGLYSKVFKPLEPDDIEKILSTSLKEEISMLRIATLRTFELADQSEDIDHSIKVLGALGLASIRTSRLLKAQKELGNGDQALSAITAAIDQVLRERGWA
jgi:uncharacterized protein YjcR